MQHAFHSFLSAFKDYVSFFFTLIYVEVNVDLQPSSHSCPMKISATGWRWGNM